MIPTASETKRLKEAVRQESERLVAFAHGYVQGALDIEHGDYPDDDEFVGRIRELYRQEYDDLEGKF